MEPNELGFGKIVEKMNEVEQRRKAVVWSWASLFGYGWTVLVNLIMVAIVFGIYDKVSGDGQIIVSILIITYLAIVNIGTQLSQLMMKKGIFDYGYTRKILDALGKEATEEEKADFENANFLLQKAEYKFVINSLFNFIVFLIALAYLFD